jgi:hypothetical protein
LPTEEGTQVSAKGADMSVPTTDAVPPEGVTKNCTCAIVAALPAAAVAVSPTFAPTVTTEPTAGVVMATVGCEFATVTATPEDVTDVAAESNATAVSVYAPATAGVHATV